MDATLTKPRRLFLCLALFLLTLALYWPVHEFGFISYDDPVYVTKNPQVQGGLSWAGLVWAGTTAHGGNWHPLTWISHMVDRQCFGQAASGPHLVNVFLHAANTVLLFLTLLRLTGAPAPSAVVAALFAWHPLHVESVAWISERKDVLSTLFLLLAVRFYASYTRRWRPESIPGKAALAYAAALVCFMLGLLSKPMLVTLPFVLLLLDVWPLRRVSLERAEPARWWRLVREKIPFFGLTAASCLVTFVAQKRGGAVASLDYIPLLRRVINALVAYTVYLRKLVWPADLAVFYPHPGSWPLTTILLSGALLLLITTAVVWMAKRRPWLAVGWFWYLGMLVPVIGLVQVGDQAYADRYTYAPLIGIFFAVVWEVKARVAGHAKAAAGANLTAGLALTACLLVSHQQLQHWKDGETLFRHSLAVTKNNYVAHGSLGMILAEAGKSDEAKYHLETALTILPSYEHAHLNLGTLYLKEGLLDKAAAHFLLAAKFKPGFPEAFYNLGTVLAQQEKHEQAVAQFEQALSLQPSHANAHYNLGISLTKLGRLQEAESHFRRAIELDPRFGFAHYNLGLVLNGLSRADEACEHFRQAAALSPDFLPAKCEHGATLLALGRFQETIAAYQDVLKADPHNPQAHNNLGLALARLGQPEAAGEHFAEVTRLEPQNADACYNYGNSLFELGNYAAAELQYLQVLRLKPDDTAAQRKLALCRTRQSKTTPAGRAP